MKLRFSFLKHRWHNTNLATSTSTWLLPRAIASQASDINNMEKSTQSAYCLDTGVRASGEFAHTYCTCQNCKIIGKVKMETTGMWGLTLIILKDIKCFKIWAYFEGIGINFNFENFQNKIFPLFILITIQSMHARYHRTFQHVSKMEDWFAYTSFSLKC